MTLGIEELVALLAQSATLSMLIVGIVEEVKKMIPNDYKKYCVVISMMFGVALLLSLSQSFPDLFKLTMGQSIFIGVFVGLGASGLYNAGLGKTLSPKQLTDESTDIYG